MTKPTEFLADLSLLFIAIIWGSTFIIVKQSVESTPVFSFLFMRFTLAGMLLGLISAPKLKALDKRVLADGLLLGIALFLAYAFQTFALTLTSASITAFITGLFVVFVPILSSVFLRKLPRQEALVGVVLATIGLALTTLQDRFLLSFGELLALLCAFFVAIHIILTDRCSRRNDFTLLTLVQINVVALFSLIFAVFLYPHVIPEQFNQQLIFSLVITSVFATVVAFGIQMGMQKHTTPTKAAIIFIMEPVSSAFFSYWLGGELLTTKQYVGTFLILLAMVVTEAGTYLKMKREAIFG
ncbi:MAG: DMT family transporter [Desulfobacterales bacterium]|nr:DMT family transporter [Desulfobacterales bacterium]